MVENFLKPKQIRPYITDIKISTFIIEWLSKETTSHKVTSLVKESPLTAKASELLIKLLDEDKHQGLLSKSFEKIATYINENQEVIQREMDGQFPALIPPFIREGISRKVSEGLYNLLQKIAADTTHPMRANLTAQLYEFADRLNTPEWQPQIAKILQTSVAALTDELRSNVQLQHDIDAWVQKTAYQFVLKNKEEVGRLISSTVENWEGKELSEKLELEVGKDLQFIRINGTLVGGLVGLLIYALTQLL